jgi:hypothetical protein
MNFAEVVIHEMPSMARREPTGTDYENAGIETRPAPLFQGRPKTGEPSGILAAECQELETRTRRVLSDTEGGH